MSILEKIAEKNICRTGIERSMCHSTAGVELPNGELLTAWYEGKYEMATNSVIAISTTEGYSSWRRQIDGKNNFKWKEPEIFIDIPETAVGNPVLLTGKDGMIWLYFVVLHGQSWTTSRIALTPLYPEKVSERAIPWPLELSNCPTGFMTKNKPLRLKSGVLLLPIYDEKSTTPLVLRSTDDGGSWYIYGETTTGFGCAEQPTLVELPDGTILMLTRTNKGRIWKSYSYNQGLTWTSSEPTEMANPNSGIDMVFTSQGRLILILNDSSFSRNRLVAMISNDQGKTWQDDSY